jgi:predicted PurR-regulated permease PerM
MKVTLPQPQHESYLQHRAQRTAQIILPVILAAAVMVGVSILVGVLAARGTGDLGRWAAVSAIWIMLPILLAGLVFLAITAGSVYLMARLLGILPIYTGRAQDFVYQLEGHIKRFSDLAVKPVFGLDEVGATLRALFGRR